jgi:Fe-S oxidoreductase
MEEATREIFAGISGVERTAFFALAYGSLIVFVGGLGARMWQWARGRKDPRLKARPIGARIRYLLKHGFLQPRVRRASSAGWLHLLIFWGFLVLFVATELLTVEIDTPLSFFSGPFYLLFSLATDLFGVVLLIGVGAGAIRRYLIRPPRLRNAAYGLPLLLLGLLAVSGFLVEGLRIAHSESVWSAWSPVGSLVARFAAVLADPQTLPIWHHRAWWGHAVIAFLFIGLIPFGSMRHAIVAPLSLLLRSDRPSGALSTPFRLEELQSGEASRVPPENETDFSWRQLMALDACTECGLCEESCPASAARRPLSPKEVVVDLRARVNRWGQRSPTPLAELIATAAAWSCTTCGVCIEVCPVGVRHIEYLVDARRAAVMNGGAPPTMAKSLEALSTRGNPFGIAAEQRLAWTANLALPTTVEMVDDATAIDVLYWVGCAGAFDEHGQRIARSVAELLGRAGVRFAVLGPAERCTGDPARRLGEEGLFQELACANIAKLDEYGVSKILTSCPHCFNIIKNEYPDFGGNYEVVHHSTYLAELIEAGRLNVNSVDRGAITYHDACYLGRHNGVVEQPREVLRAASDADLREMQCAGAESFCCGAGGGHAWFDLEHGEKINAIRYDQAAATGAETIATACPYCALMFDEISSARDEASRLSVRDIAEILNEASRS